MKSCFIFSLVLCTTTGYHFLSKHDENNFMDELLHPPLYEVQLDEIKNRSTRSVETSEIEKELQGCCVKLKSLRDSCCGQYGVFQPAIGDNLLALQCLVDTRTKDLKDYCDNPDGFLSKSISKDPLRNQIEQNLCIRECLARKKNLVDSLGNLLEEVTLEYMKENLISKEELWGDGIVDKVIVSCLNEAKKTVAAFESPGKKLKCNPSASVFHRCLWRRLELECLKDKQKTCEMCTIRRAVFTQEEKQITDQ